jgi:1,4-dihydroxy-2-naphthoyl-CoA hydrolase
MPQEPLPTDPEQTRRVRELMPYAGLLGVEILSWTAEEVRARLPWDASRCTSNGVMHGGALMGLADTLGGMCAFLNLPEGATGTTTIESKTNFLRAVRDRYVEAVATPLHTGRTVIVIETDLFDADGKRVAKVTQSQAVLR